MSITVFDYLWTLNLHQRLSMQDTYRFYVYAYIRSKDSSTAKAGTPYYIGKGCGGRAWDKNTHYIIPKDKKYIIILEKDLTEFGSLAIERHLIEWYGRIDLGNGILRNLTDGGEGASGRIYSIETRQKMSLAAKNRSDEHRQKLSSAAKGKTLSIETKQKISEAIKRRPPISDETRQKKSLAAKNMSAETRQKRLIVSESRKGKSRPKEVGLNISKAKRKIYIIVDIEGNETITDNAKQYCVENNHDYGGFTQAAKYNKKYKGLVIKIQS